MRHHSSRLVSATANSLREILKGVRSHPLVVLTSISFSRPSASKLRISKPKPSPSCRSEEHTSELQSLMRISYAVFCLKKNHHEHTRDAPAMTTSTALDYCLWEQRTRNTQIIRA